MNHDDFEQRLQRQPLRPPPAAWRAEILAACGAPGIARPERERRSLRPSDARHSAPPWWLAWLNPSRVGWAALGAVWLVIFALHSANDSDLAIAPALRATTSPQDWLERRRVMAELLGPTEPAEPPAVTRPRSERRTSYGTA